MRVLAQSSGFSGFGESNLTMTERLVARSTFENASLPERTCEGTCALVVNRRRVSPWATRWRSQLEAFFAAASRRRGWLPTPAEPMTLPDQRPARPWPKRNQSTYPSGIPMPQLQRRLTSIGVRVSPTPVSADASMTNSVSATSDTAHKPRIGAATTTTSWLSVYRPESRNEKAARTAATVTL